MSEEIIKLNGDAMATQQVDVPTETPTPATPTVPSIPVTPERRAMLKKIAQYKSIFPEEVVEPRDAIAELTPMIRPCESTSGPPEFPGLIAASV